MTTKTLEITNFVELHAILSSKPLDVGRWIYRGHADSNWPLIPKKGRDKYHDACEEEMIKQWQTFSHFYLFEQNHMDTNSLNSWPCLAIAQHYGVPTRLLDWSDNPLVACFFALSDDQHANSNGALYAYRLNDKDLNELICKRCPSPLDIDNNIEFFEPASVILRIIRQRGVFTVHGPANRNLADHTDPERLVKIVIKCSAKPAMLKDLERYQINHMHCFPDLEGVGKYVDWLTRQSAKPLDCKYDLEFSEISNLKTVKDHNLYRRRSSVEKLPLEAVSLEVGA